ncbi:DsbA family protein [Parenemella sanctibonifatiensis]|nr:thioredoxin domain-containing protein [Parenemella sanctibonifatiensis]
MSDRSSVPGGRSGKSNGSRRSDRTSATERSRKAGEASAKDAEDVDDVDESTDADTATESKSTTRKTGTAGKASAAKGNSSKASAQGSSAKASSSKTGATSAAGRTSTGAKSKSARAEEAKRKEQSDRRAALAERRLKEARKARTKKMVLWFLAILAAVALIAGAVFGYQWLQNRNRVPDIPVQLNADESAVAFYPGQAPDAPVVTLYYDYQCPYCRTFEDANGETLVQLATEGKIQLEYHPMIFLDQGSGSDNSLRATSAAMCTITTPRFFAFHDKLFDTQGSQWPDEMLFDLAEEADITGDDLDRMRECYDNRQMESWVQNANQTAFDAGITGTPAMTVNGQEVNLGMVTSPEDLEPLIMQTAGA